MKSIVSTLLFITLPFIIYGEKTSEKFPLDVALLNEMARVQININCVLILKEDGFLGDGGTGFVYEGFHIFDQYRQKNEQLQMKRTFKNVAIKFVPDAQSPIWTREYEMLTYLGAYKTPEVEKYGIPTVYYHGRWGNFTLTALTKLDTDIVNIANSEHKLKNPLDVLMLMRDFLIQLKYMHSCGVRHNDVKPTNIMVRNHKSYLIDFHMGTKMAEDNNGGTVGYAVIRSHQRETRLAIDDLESYFYSICHVLGCRFPWLHPKRYETSDTEGYQSTAGLRSQVDKIPKFIDKCIKNDILKMVIHEFVDDIYAVPSKAFPDYNRLYELVRGEIEKLHRRRSTLLPPMFSWMTDAQKTIAALEKYSKLPPNFNITYIAEPSLMNFATFVYPAVVYENVT